MSLRYEQERALLHTREFLRDLLDPKRRPKTVRLLKDRIRSCLKHFPPLDEKGRPIWSQDEFSGEGK